MNTTKIVWNGCDSYIELTQAIDRGMDVEGDELYTRREIHKAFEVIECDLEDVPLDELGEKDFDGLFVTESGKIYREPPDHSGSEPKSTSAL